MHAILSLDAALFHCINTGMGNPVFDALLPLFREKWLWAPLYLFLATFFLLNYGRKGWIIILTMVLAVGLADFTSSAPGNGRAGADILRERIQFYLLTCRQSFCCGHFYYRHNGRQAAMDSSCRIDLGRSDRFFTGVRWRTLSIGRIRRRLAGGCYRLVGNKNAVVI